MVICNDIKTLYSRLKRLITYFLHRKERTVTVKMRVAVAFILLFSLTMAFTINKERPVTDDEQHNEVTIFKALNITKINVNSYPVFFISF